MPKRRRGWDHLWRAVYRPRPRHRCAGTVSGSLFHRSGLSGAAAGCGCAKSTRLTRLRAAGFQPYRRRLASGRQPLTAVSSATHTTRRSTASFGKLSAAWIVEFFEMRLFRKNGLGTNGGVGCGRTTKAKEQRTRLLSSLFFVLSSTVRMGDRSIGLFRRLVLPRV